MAEFKVGDVVERVANGGRLTFLHCVGPGPHVVTSVSSTGEWIGVNGWADANGDTEPWYAINFTLIEQQDDPLPPAPESVMYVGRQVQTRILRVKTYAVSPTERVVDLHIGGGILDDGKSCSLDADAALQLAHDLTRMAMEIKRRERAQSGE